MSIASELGAVAGGISGIGNAAGSIASRLGLTPNFFQQLRPATFRGISFGVHAGESSFGRRQHLHEYVNRDTPWAEDLGKKSRRYNVVGFLLGDDVISQREQMIAAVETKGVATLVHPSYGELKVSVMDFTVIEHEDKGRYFELHFSFVETGERLFPTNNTQTSYSISIAGLNLNVTAAASFAKSALGAISTYAKAAGAAVTTVTTLYATAQGISRDVQNAFKAVSTLTGSFGRYIGSSSSTLSASTSTVSSTPAPASVSAALDAAVTSQATVVAAGAALVTAANALDASTVADFSDAATALATSILNNSVDPADAIRNLSQLAAYAPSAPTSASVTGTALATMQTATGALIRRAGLTALATASGNYQPESQDDALAVRAKVVALIDDEIDVAGDTEDDDAYTSLRALRASVINDLNTRGAALPALKTFTFRASLPSLLLANRIYRDADRSDDLVAQANPIHPAFMPTTFVALSE